MEYSRTKGKDPAWVTIETVQTFDNSSTFFSFVLDLRHSKQNDFCRLSLPNDPKHPRRYYQPRTFQSLFGVDWRSTVLLSLLPPSSPLFLLSITVEFCVSFVFYSLVAIVPQNYIIHSSFEPCYCGGGLPSYLSSPFVPFARYCAGATKQTLDTIPSKSSNTGQLAETRDDRRQRNLADFVSVVHLKEE